MFDDIVPLQVAEGEGAAAGVCGRLHACQGDSCSNLCADVEGFLHYFDCDWDGDISAIVGYESVVGKGVQRRARRAQITSDWRVPIAEIKGDSEANDGEERTKKLHEECWLEVVRNCIW